VWNGFTAAIGSPAHAASIRRGPIHSLIQCGGQLVAAIIVGTGMTGNFTLSFGGNTTGNIAYNASAATVQSALEGLASIGSGNVSVTKVSDTPLNQQWQITFQGSLAAANQTR
jgi:hypothetical protein